MTENSTETLTIEYSLDDGRTWSVGMSRPDTAMTRQHLSDFRSVVRYEHARHGHGVRTRVIDYQGRRLGADASKEQTR